MARTAQIICKELISHYANIEKTRKKSEELLRVGTLSNRDVDIIYYGLFMDAVVSFERFLEELFLNLLSNPASHSCKRVKPKTHFASIEIARSFMLGERSYVDWLPYDRQTKKRAKRYFINGLPFTGLDRAIDLNVTPSLDKRIAKITERTYIIRNALAHKSEHSYAQFKKEIIDGAGALHSREKKPIGYIRGAHSNHPTLTTRYEQIVNDLKYVSILITSKRLK